MNILKRLFLSMGSMTVLLLLFATGIGIATFIENDHGTESAKVLVYNALWFEIVLVLLAINLVYNIFKYKLYGLKKLPVFLFHLGFLVIILGAAVTRYIGYEGTMHIREGETSNSMSSYNTYFYVSNRQVPVNLNV